MSNTQLIYTKQVFFRGFITSWEYFLYQDVIWIDFEKESIITGAII